MGKGQDLNQTRPPLEPGRRAPGDVCKRGHCGLWAMELLDEQREFCSFRPRRPGPGPGPASLSAPEQGRSIPPSEPDGLVPCHPHLLPHGPKHPKGAPPPRAPGRPPQDRAPPHLLTPLLAWVALLGTHTLAGEGTRLVCNTVNPTVQRKRDEPQLPPASGPPGPSALAPVHSLTGPRGAAAARTEQTKALLSPRESC